MNGHDSKKSFDWLLRITESINVQFIKVNDMFFYRTDRVFPTRARFNTLMSVCVGYENIRKYW